MSFAERAGSAAIVDHAQTHHERAGHESGERDRAARAQVGEEREHVREDKADQEAPVYIARPPIVGVGTSCRALGLVDRPIRARRAPDEGRHDERRSSARGEDDR